MRVFGSGTVAGISSVFAERSQTICPRTDQNLFLCRRDILLLTKVCLQTTLLQSAAEREGQTAPKSNLFISLRHCLANSSVMPPDRKWTLGTAADRGHQLGQLAVETGLEGGQALAQSAIALAHLLGNGFRDSGCAQPRAWG